jgi:hypothetical protein
LETLQTLISLIPLETGKTLEAPQSLIALVALVALEPGKTL